MKSLRRQGLLPVGWALLAGSLGVTHGVEATGLSSELLATLGWMLWVEASSVAAFPWIQRLLPGCPDRGWMAAKWFGLLLPTYAGWLVGTVAGVDLAVSGTAVVVLQLVVGPWTAKSREVEGDASQGRVWGWILAGEILFWTAFAGFLALRSLNPEIWHPVVGGEKPMDLAILSSLTRSSGFPPLDPWLAGHTLNYYYFGYLPHAWVAQVLGIPASLAYNLALPTVAGLVAGAAFLVVATLQERSGVRAGRSVGSEEETLGRGIPSRTRIRRALWGPLLVVGVGNWFEPRLLASGLRLLGVAPDQGWPGWLGLPLETGRGLIRWLSGEGSWPYSPTSLYWSATRIIPSAAGEAAPISEFPFFSLLFGDLHPHLLALPAGIFFLLTLGGISSRGEGPTRPAPWGPGALAGFALGLVALSNPWDTVSAGLLLLGFVVGWAPQSPGGLTGGRFGTSLLTGAVVLVVGIMTALPFLWTYVAPVGGVGVWRGSGTILESFIWHFGLPVLILTGLLLRRWNGTPALRKEIGEQLGAKLTGRLAPVLAVGIVVLAATDQISGAAAAVLLLAGATVGVGIRAGWGHGRQACLLILVGSVLVLLPEFVAVAGDLGRMNLVFKLHYGAFWIWSVAAALVLTGREELFPRGALGKIVLGVGVAAALAYGPFAVWGRIEDRLPQGAPATLDGLRNLDQIPLSVAGEEFLPAGDLSTIRWLKSHAPADGIVLEAVTPSYGPGGRISAGTGIPTLLAWPGHQLQHRSRQQMDREIKSRREAVEAIYRAERTRDVTILLQRYRVGLVVFGNLERTLYGPDAETKFVLEIGFWERVFTSGSTSVYRLKGQK